MPPSPKARARAGLWEGAWFPVTGVDKEGQAGPDSEHDFFCSPQQQQSKAPTQTFPRTPQEKMQEAWKEPAEDCLFLRVRIPPAPALFLLWVP